MTASTKESAPLLQLRQPDFTADEGDPFANDRLNRQPRVEALCRLITNLQGPAVLAVAAGFGDGKTAFLRMSFAHLRSQETRVVTYNAWLQGHTGDPLLDLMSVLIDGLDRPSVLQDLLPKLGTRALHKMTGGLMRMEDFQRQPAETFKKWTEVEGVRCSLQEGLAEAVEKHGGKVVVLIDELDRCLPKYALGTLDAVRNLLDVPGVVVVLGLNPREMAARIRQLYGSDTDAETFLRRFVDYTIDLQRPNADNSDMDRFLSEVGTSAKTKNHLRLPSSDYTSQMIKVMVNRFKMSLRDTEQLISRVNVSFAPLEQNTKDAFVQSCLVLMSLRLADADAYHALLRDPSQVMDAARALSRTLEVTVGDTIGLRMVAILIRVCKADHPGLTKEDFLEEGPFPGGTDKPQDITDSLWQHYQSMKHQWFTVYGWFQLAADLIELSK